MDLTFNHLGSVFIFLNERSPDFGPLFALVYSRFVTKRVEESFKMMICEAMRPIRCLCDPSF